MNQECASYRTSFKFCWYLGPPGPTATPDTQVKILARRRPDRKLAGSVGSRARSLLPATGWALLDGDGPPGYKGSKVSRVAGASVRHSASSKVARAFDEG